MASLKLQIGTTAKGNPLEIKIGAPGIKWSADSRVPGSVQAARGVAAQLFGPGGNLLDRTDQCGEVLWTRLLEGVRSNPAWLPDVGEETRNFLPGARAPIRKGPFRVITAEVDARWVADLLAEALSKLRTVPTWSRLGSIDVVVGKLNPRVRAFTSPEGAIFLNALYFTGDASMDRAFPLAIVAHELFHKIQYSLGFRGGEAEPVQLPYAWFSEGTASWAEFFVAENLTSEQKLLAAWSHPELGLYNSSYHAFPFWFHQTGRSTDAAALATLLGRIGANPNRLRSESERTATWNLFRGAFQARRGRAWRTASVTVRGGPLRRALTPTTPIARDLPSTGIAHGWLPALSAHLYRVPANARVQLWPEASKELRLLRSKNDPTQVAVIAQKMAEYALLLGDSPYSPPPALTADWPTSPPAGGWKVTLDGAGNVLVYGRATAAIGFSLNGYSSIGQDDPAAPGSRGSWSRSRSTTYVFNLRAPYTAVLPTVRRQFSLKPEGDRTRLTISTELTVVDGTPLPRTFESVVLSGGRETLQQLLDADGESSPNCTKGSNDCDGDCRPAWPHSLSTGDTPRGLAPVEDLVPIVPYVGKAIFPVPAKRYIEEVYYLAKF